MAQVQVTELVDAPLPELWESWDRFGDIARFNPNLRASYLIGDKRPTGLGAERQCDFEDGRNHVRERIVAYHPRERIEIDVYDGTLPIRDARAAFEFKAIGPERSRVTMTLSFRPKYGPMGFLMVPAMKAQMRAALARLLASNKAFV